MNTLTLETPSTTPRTADEQACIARGKQAKAAWRAWLAKGHKPCAAQMAIYAFLRGAAIEKAFTPISNGNKLSNGQRPWQGRDAALWQASQLRHAEWAPFSDMLEGAKSEDLRWPQGAKGYVAGSYPLLEAFKLEAERVRNQKSDA